MQNTLIAIWWLEPEIASLVALVHQLRALHDSHPEGIFLYNVITATTEMPQPAAREALREHFSSMRGKLIAAALIVERPGIQGSLSRAVLTTIYTLSRSPFAMKIFSSRRTAAEWLAGHPRALPANLILTRIESLAASAH
ncbi:MAG: hypothetical protein WDO74_15075 [Pseudomonadota bacterium]